MRETRRFMVGYHPARLHIEIPKLDDLIDDEIGAAITSYFVTHEIQFSDSFIRKSLEYFRRPMGLPERYEASDVFFANLTGFHNYLMNEGRFDESETQIFRVIRFARFLEAQLGFELHLGTPFYFLGEAALMQGDIEAGLLGMSASRKQDRTHVPHENGLPAELFITFNDASIRQHFREYVREVADYVRSRIWTFYYSGFSAGETRLGYEEFRFRFVENDEIPDDLKFFFLYAVLSLKELEKLQYDFSDEEIAAPLIYSDATLRLTSLMDFFTADKITEDKFAHRLSWIAKECGLHTYPAVQTYTTMVGTGPYIRTNGFDAWINDIYDETFTTQERPPRHLRGLEADLAITHGVRNFSAHTIKSEHALWKHHQKVTQGILNSLFLILQTLLRPHKTV